MKKVILAAAVLVASASVANAEGYNRVALSYDWQHYSMNKDYTGTDKTEGRSLNGFGINYAHGFGVAENMFVEVGGNFNFGFGSEKGEKVEYAGYWFQDKQKMTNINLRVPVNFVYRFNVSDDFKIAPYVGINFKLNLVTKMKDVVDSNLSKDELKDLGYEEPDWVNVYSDSKENMGDGDYTWNRFQMGWQIGVGFEYQKYYLGVQYGTDFIPAYSHKFEWDGGSSKPKINSQALKISLGYTF
ncbi:MAG: outer membrane beta-barrel protein [bacterium]|nr:outer membrane beta-barrel protein [bacterium]